MTSTQRAYIIASCLVLIFVLGLIVSITYSGRKGDIEESQRVKQCLAAGNQWVDVSLPDDHYFYGCIGADKELPR